MFLLLYFVFENQCDGISMYLTFVLSGHAQYWETSANRGIYNPFTSLTTAMNTTPSLSEGHVTNNHLYSFPTNQAWPSNDNRQISNFDVRISQALLSNSFPGSGIQTFDHFEFHRFEYDLSYFL